MGQTPNHEPRGCLGVVFWILDQVFGAGAPQEASFPYVRSKRFLSPAERSLFGVLKNVIGADYELFVKVRLADVVSVRKGTQKWQSHFNRISAKHVDFLVCSRDEVASMLVIELDDKSHARADRKRRDEFVDRALASAELPILRLKARSAYDEAELARQIHDAIRTADPNAVRPPRLPESRPRRD